MTTRTEIRLGDKVYLVTREDLEPGQQAVQAAHSLREFTAAHPELDKRWYEQSNHLAFLAARNETELERLLEKARIRGISAAPFYEPDLGNALTAVAFGPEARKICSNLPCALKQRGADDR